ncbi:hypothetical protein XELAEV_18008270mg [Xenopus laevis]|uniref:Uncharacterized protein n=1 Tax=Xenopus laevis TaxID=8355 RepID=A0A974E2B3_XENLA|nr:hypothetical protein XELAEV_18008270mg [Xenopus laevis]
MDLTHFYGGFSIQTQWKRVKIIIQYRVNHIRYKETWSGTDRHATKSSTTHLQNMVHKAVRVFFASIKTYSITYFNIHLNH